MAIPPLMPSFYRTARRGSGDRPSVDSCSGAPASWPAEPPVQPPRRLASPPPRA